MQYSLVSLRKLVSWLLILAPCLVPRSTPGYALEGAYWVDDSTITMQLSLGPTTVHLQDGFPTWDNSAADALGLWNAELATIKFGWVLNSPAPKASGDDTNSVFFDSTVFGDDFGEGVLATTVYQTDSRNFMTEGDVVVNEAFDFNSYRGPLQGSLYDIHRVLLHEFGHVIGLAHPDGPSSNQDVVAIMNSVIGNLDHLADDDIDGASFLYGLRFSNDNPLTIKVGEPIDYEVATNVAANSYTAVGLPPGVALDFKTGVMTGAATLRGLYYVDITIDGPGSPNTQQFLFVVQPNPPGDLRATFSFATNRLLLDPTRSRVYASLAETNSIAVIETSTLSLVGTIPVNGIPQGMAMSPDGSKLYVTEIGGVSQEIGVLDLNSLSALPSLPAPAECTDIEAGAFNRLYVATATNDLSTSLFQLDATNGNLLAPFPDGILTGHLEMSADRTRLYLATADNPSHTLYLFDTSLESPVVLQTNRDRGSLFRDLKLSHDGKFFCFADPGLREIPKVPSDDLSGTLGVFSVTNAAWAAIAFSPDDQLFFKQGNDYYFSQFDTYDVTTTKFVRSLQGDYWLNPSDMVADSSGQYLFVSSASPPELEVLGTGAGTPTHPPKAKRLLNLSTRLKAGEDEDVLIGGFIITGSGPKQVVIRGIGPSLRIAGDLPDPVLAVYDQAGDLVNFGDNWNEDRQGVLLTGLAPGDEHEPVVIASLNPGAYTAVLQGARGGSGVALVELYDLTADGDSTVANISTRGKVETGDNVMIGGFIISNDIPTRVMVRAIGPSLAKSGIAGALQDPVLELHGGDGDLIFSNDNWRSTQQADIIATGIPPSDDRESAIIATLQPGNYTGIVRGQADSTGVALVEIYNLDYASAAR